MNYKTILIKLYKKFYIVQKNRDAKYWIKIKIKNVSKNRHWSILSNKKYWFSQVVFEKNCEVWVKFGFLSKILIFEKNLNVWGKFLFLTKISIFDENFYFWRKFRFLSKISIFWRKFRFSSKISIFDENFDFWGKFRRLTKI